MDSPMAIWFGALVKQPAANLYKSISGQQEEELLIERHELDRLDNASLSALQHQLTTMQLLNSHPGVATIKVRPEGIDDVDHRRLTCLIIIFRPH